MFSRVVLDELQRIADNADTLRRNRGRRGLEILSRLQKDGTVPVDIVDDGFPEIGEVDAKLVALARSRGGTILTNDFNLNRVAEIQGVRVMRRGLMMSRPPTMTSSSMITLPVCGIFNRSAPSCT